MTEILEKDRDRLLTELSAAASAEKAVGILEKETDKLLLTYNERAESDSEREAAAHIMQAVRLSLPLIDTAGRSKVWEHGKHDEKAPKKISVTVVLIIIAGLALCAFGLIPIAMIAMNNTDAASRTDLVSRMISSVLGIAALFLAGTLSGRPKDNVKKEYHVELHIDADKVYRNFRTVILSVDQSLEEVRLREAQDKREQAGTIDGRPATTPEIELFSDLLAAMYSRDPDYALEKIADIKYYLHRQQIEIVDYSEETKHFFDMMPGTSAGTIRPALVADGVLMKKGLASTGGR